MDFSFGIGGLAGCGGAAEEGFHLGDGGIKDGEAGGEGFRGEGCFRGEDFRGNVQCRGAWGGEGGGFQRVVLEETGEVGGILAAGGCIDLELAEFLCAIVFGEAGDADESAFFAEFLLGFFESSGEGRLLGGDFRAGFFQGGKCGCEVGFGFC